jgi:hypothetical protein
MPNFKRSSSNWWLLHAVPAAEAIGIEGLEIQSKGDGTLLDRLGYDVAGQGSEQDAIPVVACGNPQSGYARAGTKEHPFPENNEHEHIALKAQQKNVHSIRPRHLLFSDKDHLVQCATKASEPAWAAPVPLSPEEPHLRSYPTA